MFGKKEHFKKNIIVRVPRKTRADVLLVYPPWVAMGARGYLQRMLPPLGILSIASYLESQNYEVHIADLHGERLNPAQFRQILQSLRPRVVGLTVLCNHFIPANYIAYLCKQEVADCKVYVGGVHAEIYPEQMLCNPSIDAVARGDGEEIMLELMREEKYSNILGLSYRCSAGTVVHNPPRPIETNLDKYPFPAYHLINFDNYFPAVGSYRNLPAMNVIMTRGCPGRCNFCNSARTTMRSRSPAKTVELIKMLRHTYGIRQFYFYDDTFTAIPKAVRQFCDLMIKDKVDVSFVCYARADMFSDELAQLLAQAGCHQILLGIESGNAALNVENGKPIAKEKYKEIVQLAHQHGIEVRGSFIIGHIEETKETLVETLQFAIDIDVDFFYPCILTPYPGTQLYNQAKANNLILHEQYALYGLGEVILKMNHLTAQQLTDFYFWCFLKFYFRPIAIWRQLKRMRHWHHMKDLLVSLFILVTGSLRRNRPNKLQDWLNFEPSSITNQNVHSPRTPRLTFEVRQKQL